MSEITSFLTIFRVFPLIIYDFYNVSCRANTNNLQKYLFFVYKAQICISVLALRLEPTAFRRRPGRRKEYLEYPDIRFSALSLGWPRRFHPIAKHFGEMRSSSKSLSTICLQKLVPIWKVSRWPPLIALPGFVSGTPPVKKWEEICLISTANIWLSGSISSEAVEENEEFSETQEQEVGRTAVGGRRSVPPRPPLLCRPTLRPSRAVRVCVCLFGCVCVCVWK